MKVKLTNIVDNTVDEESEFIPSSGLSYLIEMGEKTVMFDAGDQGHVLIHNMNLLNINPDSIDLLILSHGHWDHTFGLKALMGLRSNLKQLKIVAHPHAFLKRKVIFPLSILSTIKFRARNLGFPNLPKIIKENLILEPTTEPYKITPYLTTTGEISDRKEPESLTNKLKIKQGWKYVEDGILDDLSLILKTKEGIVIICGCGHSGVLNICAKAKEMYPNLDIKTILGGTHLVALTEEKELEYVAKKLESEYNKPTLYFSHCTGKKAIKFMTEYFGEQIVKPFRVGDTLTFEC